METKMSLIEQLKAYETILVKPEIRPSSFDLTELIDENFVEFTSTGKTLNKQQVVDFLLNEKTSNNSLSNFNLIQLSNDTVLLTYHYIKFVNDEKTQSLRSSIWKFSNDKWQILFHQGTITKNNPQ